MKKISTLFIAVTIAVASFGQTTWKADKAHTQLKFDITHLGVSTVSGAFTDFDASIVASKADFSDGIFTLTAKAASINTGVQQRDEHLKSADFFDVATHPELSFKSTSLVKNGNNKYKVSGNLTIHGVTKPVTLDLWYRGTITNPMSQKPDAGFRVTGSIKRSDFGIGGKFPEAMLSEEVNIVADGEFGS